jgi:hypothetical protein
LDDAIAQGLARVTELTAAGSVPELRFENDADRPVLLLDGEELIGAKQNRVLNLTVLAPAKQSIVIPVSCVEAGRWHAEAPDFKTAEHVLYSRARAHRTAQVTASMRASGTRRSNQSAIWDDIADKSLRMNAHSSTVSGPVQKYPKRRLKNPHPRHELERHLRRCRQLLRSAEVNEIQELKRQGLSICAIAAVTGFDRKTVRRYLADPVKQPRYGPRPKRAGPLEEFKSYIDDRLSASVWNAVVLLRELRERGYRGGYTILKDYLQPKREAARATAVRRFETPPGRQAQVDWGHLGTLEVDGEERKLSGFTFTLGYSRMMMAEATLDQKLGTVLRLHEEAFRQLGACRKRFSMTA